MQLRLLGFVFKFSAVFLSILVIRGEISVEGRGQPLNQPGCLLTGFMCKR